MKKITATILFWGLCQLVIAQNCPMEMGMNLYSNVKWSREMPFANLMFQSDSWVTQNQNFVPDGLNSFDTKVIDSIQLDENGYPLSLPQKVVGTEAPQSLVTLLIKDNGGIHPNGNYLLTYKGHGEVILVGADVSSLVSAENNSRVYHIIVQSKGDIGVKIISSDENDPVHDIKVMLPGHAETDIFNKDFVEKIRLFSTIRFMNWQNINHSEEDEWSSRAKDSYYTMSTLKGVPLEYMIELCNLINANIWINIPHQASDNYVTLMAEMLKNNLNSGLQVYVEYSNEVWNVSFPQHDWVDENAPSSILSPEQKYAYFTKKSFIAFSEVFKDDLGRITRVLAGQQANPNVINRSSQAMKDQNSVDLYDAVSCTGSLYFTVQQYQELNQASVIEDIALMMRTNMQGIFRDAMLLHKNKADSLGKKFVGYESSGLGSVSYISPELKPDFSDNIQAYNSDTAMYNVYTEWLQFLRDEIKLELCCSFVLADDNDAIYGSYGHLNSIFESKPYPLAYQAITSVNCNVLEVKDGEIAPSIAIYPNPTSSILTISTGVDQYNIYDINGKLILTGIKGNNLKEIDISNYTPGIYFIRIYINNQTVTKKVIKI